MSLKYCSRHMVDLNAELVRKGMKKLLCDDPARAAQFATDWLAGKSPLTMWCPRIVAMLEINKKITELVGARYLMNGGTRCPLCIVPKALKNAEADRLWIDNVTDLMLVTAKTNRLL